MWRKAFPAAGREERHLESLKALQIKRNLVAPLLSNVCNQTNRDKTYVGFTEDPKSRLSADN
jgi:hypothetical protein